MIEIKNLSVSYDKEQGNAIERVSLSVPPGTVCAVIGPSGCGKSTLLKAVAGIERPASGTVLFRGEPVSPKRQRIGFMPQSYGLLPWRTARENILLGIRICSSRKSMADPDAAADALMAELGIEKLGDRYPGELSGGQQQRVALARVFLLQPDILLMDEPFSALDAISRERMQEVFLSLWRNPRITTILVTHYVEEALYLGGRIVLMGAGPGHIAEELENPMAGDPDFRRNPDFFSRGRELREKIVRITGGEVMA